MFRFDRKFYANLKTRWAGTPLLVFRPKGPHLHLADKLQFALLCNPRTIGLPGVYSDSADGTKGPYFEAPMV